VIVSGIDAGARALWIAPSDELAAPNNLLTNIRLPVCLAPAATVQPELASVSGVRLSVWLWRVHF